MKILFTVQAEGRGHMTQAIAVSQMLKEQGHELVAVIGGGTPEKPMPAFFERAFDVPVQRVASPIFAQSNNRGISVFDSGRKALESLPSYRKSLAAIKAAIGEHKPDLVINFLEPMMGVFNVLHRPKTPTLVIGHQFMIQHPSYFKVKEFRRQQVAMKNYVRMTGARSLKLALSFYPAPDAPEERIIVCPPILRRQLFALKPTDGERLLVYLVLHGFSEDILAWHREHPDVAIDCFYDKPGAPAEEKVDATFSFHRLDGEKFLRCMAASRAVVCTAGFESVCEAAYLGKTLLMVPVENHLEQFINSIDAEQSGIGIRDTKFALSRLVFGAVQPAGAIFRKWVDCAPATVERAIQAAVKAKLPADSAPEIEEIAQALAR